MDLVSAMTMTLLMRQMSTLRRLDQTQRSTSAAQKVTVLIVKHMWKTQKRCSLTVLTRISLSRNVRL